MAEPSVLFGTELAVRIRRRQPRQGGTATIRAQLISIAGRITRSARRATIRLPTQLTVGQRVFRNWPSPESHFPPEPGHQPTPTAARRTIGENPDQPAGFIPTTTVNKRRRLFDARLERPNHTVQQLPQRSLCRRRHQARACHYQQRDESP